MNEVGKLIAESEREALREARAERTKLIETLESIDRRLAEMNAPPPAPRLVRSAMSAREKAEFIEEHGGDRYLALPWQ
jgi:hypothetical protein